MSEIKTLGSGNHTLCDTGARERLNAMSTATDSDVGKALKAKTVTDGKVTEWEFGEAGGDSTGILDYLADSLCTFTQIAQDGSISTNRKINPDTGLAPIITGGYGIIAFKVTSGTTVKATNNFNMQFQTQRMPKESGEPNRIGQTYGEGTYVLTVPESATYLAMSTYVSEPVGEVWLVENISTDVERAVDYVDENEAIINSRLDMTTVESDTNSPQLVDLSLYPNWAVVGAFHEYRNVRLDFSRNGLYAGNPVGYANILAVKLYDENDNLLTFNNGASNSFETGFLSVLEKIDDTHVKQYTFSSIEALKDWNVYQITDREYNGVISYGICGLRTGGNSNLYGVTHERVTDVYIPYGKNITYSDEMSNAVWDAFVSKNKFYDLPEKHLNPWMQRSYATTDNLLDDRKIDWNPNSTNYLKLKSGEMIPVEGGRTILCNKGLNAIKWIDANGTATSIGNKGANTAIVLPDEAVAITFSTIWASEMPNGYEPVYIRYLDRLYPADDKDRNNVPMAQINGWDISKNVYDYAIPDETSNIVRMMKTFAIRELNHQRNAFRIGTFNVYVNRQATNKEIIRKMMGTYGIDLCGFQESQNYQNGTRYNLGDYLKGWQFGYCSTAEEDLASARHIVSALEIASSEAFSIGTGTNTCLKCVINMPRYKDYKDGLTTLSFYTYHGIVNSDSEREIEVNDILAKVALDTSDFIIVCGDTNDFSGQPNYTYDRWAQFAAAGLTPVHDGSSETVTDRSCSIDNIFVSSNISCLYYNVINSGDWIYTPTGSTTAVPVSDHDFLYADLQFDFEAVINARNQESN